MDKNHIIRELIRTAKHNNGTPLSIDRFFKETGIRKEDWYGKYWIKWSEAQLEADLLPNKFGKAKIDLDEILVKIANLIEFLGKVPTKPQLKLAKRSDLYFPSTITIQKRIGSKEEMVKKVFDFCSKNDNFREVTKICKEYINQLVIIEDHIKPEILDNSLISGDIYLLKHGKHYKIGRSKDATRRYKDIKIQMPMETEEIHIIHTDDTVGIEAYWHKRFASKRDNGEWFSLNSNDIKAFKRRKFM